MSEYSPYDGEWEHDDNDEFVDIVIDELVTETELAICIKIEKELIWIPKSQCEDWPDQGESGVVVMKEWIAADKELI